MELTTENLQIIFASATIVLGAITPSLAIGKIASTGLEAIGRNPEAAADVKSTMILGVAFAEAIAIYSLVVALIIKFV
ncbi:MAG: ATP synthase F0 subunit C [Candidatus Pacebacteria bacterium]|jgi:F-type H+-transporting ATPase subunit c|nr:ATP synthase F0 subunit C [Candidatus Paceibacterota bacterium]